MIVNFNSFDEKLEVFFEINFMIFSHNKILQIIIWSLKDRQIN